MFMYMKISIKFIFVSNIFTYKNHNLIITIPIQILYNRYMSTYLLNKNILI